MSVGEAAKAEDFSDVGGAVSAIWWKRTRVGEGFVPGRCRFLRSVQVQVVRSLSRLLCASWFGKLVG